MTVSMSLVFKFVEPPENNERPMEQKSGVKFKIMSLKMKVPTDYMPELVCEYGEDKDRNETFVMASGCSCVFFVFAV